MYISLFIHSFTPEISIAPLQVHNYSEALPTQHIYFIRFSHRSVTGNCEWRTCPRSLRGCYRTGFDPMTLRTKGVESTNEQQAPQYFLFLKFIDLFIHLFMVW